MSEHLPECFYYMDDFGNGERCICDRLRACEQRVRMEDDDYAYVSAQAEAGGRRRGWVEALDAAREAVKAALPHADDCRAFCPCCMGDYDCNCERREALTAIDALLAKADNQRLSEDHDD